MTRGQHIERFYRAVDRLAERQGGRRRLGDCTGYQDWPDEGVAFLFSSEETRMWSDQPRLIHVEAYPGPGGRGSLWEQLRAHRGSTSGRYAGGGNHRDSPLRRRVGEAIVERDGLHDEYEQWGSWASESRPIREAEHDLEARVSDYLRECTVLALPVGAGEGQVCRREWLAASVTALVSNYAASPIDPRDDWLGLHSPDAAVRNAGLWRTDRVDAAYDERFLDDLDDAIERVGEAPDVDEEASTDSDRTDSEHADSDRTDSAAATTSATVGGD